MGDEKNYVINYLHGKMPQDIKIWEVDNKKLKEISKEELDLEERLENWIANDITTISNDLMVIGRQINTDFGGVIDLLCIDNNGDLVVIELKRDKTPREITAQVLDYASCVNNLSNEKIHEMANDYLKDKKPFDEVFEAKFGNELPEILNEHHKMLIVASEIDNSSERIVEYLSNSYGVNINVATFRYFKDNGKEFLARVFLIEPSEADYRTQTKTNSKRKPPLTYEELEKIAEKRGVGILYKKLLDGMKRCVNSIAPTRSSVAFIGVRKDKSRRTIFSILPEENDQKGGVYCEIKKDHFLQYFNMELSVLKKVFPADNKLTYTDGQGEYIIGYFKNEEQIDKFIAILKKAKK